MDTHSYLAGIASRLDCPPVLINGVADHGHLLGWDESYVLD